MKILKQAKRQINKVSEYLIATVAGLLGGVAVSHFFISIQNKGDLGSFFGSIIGHMLLLVLLIFVGYFLTVRKLTQDRKYIYYANCFIAVYTAFFTSLSLTNSNVLVTFIPGVIILIAGIPLMLWLKKTKVSEKRMRQ